MADLQKIEQILYTHQHRGDDFTQPLRGLDLQQLGKTALTAAATSLRVNIPSKQFLKILIYHGAKTGNGNNLLRFNNNSGNNYSSISRENNTARTSQSSIDLIDQNNDSNAYLYIIHVNNLPGLEKSVVSEAIRILSSSATSQSKFQVYGTFVDNINPITRVDLVASSGNFPVNSQMLILGSKE